MNRDGFTLIEVIVGMLIFMVGVLALAASTGFVSTQLQAADLRTERSIAYQQAVERLHSLDYDTELVTRAPGDAVTMGDYQIWWEVAPVGWGLKEIDVISEGPGYQNGRLVPTVLDELTIRIARPAP